MCGARGAPHCARGERDPREDAAMIACLKSISLVTLVLVIQCVISELERDYQVILHFQYNLKQLDRK